MKKFLRVLLILIVVCCSSLYVFLHKDEYSAKKKIDGIEEYAQKVNNISIPSNAKVISLGEATHGNSEFQQLKLTIFKQLVENNNTNAIAFEMEMGEGAYINDYIHQESDKTIDEIMDIISFDIYHTIDIRNLIEWMRNYNIEHNNELSFYGFDFQNPNMTINYLLDKNIGLDESILSPLTTSDISLSDSSVQNSIAYLNDLDVSEYDNNTQLFIRNVLNCFAYYSSVDMNNYVEANTLRDSYMASNVLDILNISDSSIMITGHNGHIAKSNVMYTSMGSNLDDQLGDDYYTMGTDYFYSTCNLPTMTNRKNYKFCSADRLAYQAKYMDDKMYFLDFDEAIKNNQLDTLLNSYNNAGDIGENYSLIMSLIPSSTRKKQVFTNLYDAMIFVYQASPIEIVVS